MDVCFENVGSLELKAVVEMRYRMNLKSICAWVVAYLLVGAYFLRSFLMGNSYLITPIIGFVFAAIMALSPYLRVRKGWKQSLAFHDGKLPVNTARFGENISVENAEGSRNWEYYQLVKVRSFKYSYCLCFGDKTVLLLYRDHFTKGTFEEFKQFLRMKRPDLKIPE